MYFETKVRYDKTHENGIVKSVTEPYLVDALTCTEAEARITKELEPYLVDALTCTEAEARITKELEPYISGDFSITSIKQSKLSDIVFTTDTEAERYYLVKVDFVTIDEKTAQEKATASSILVQAASFNDAKNRFEKFMHDSMADWEYVSIALTPIVDVFRYDAPQAETEHQ